MLERWDGGEPTDAVEVEFRAMEVSERLLLRGVVSTREAGAEERGDRKSVV